MRHGAKLTLWTGDQRSTLTFGHFGAARLQIEDAKTGEGLDDREVMLDPEELGELSRLLGELPRDRDVADPDVRVVWGPGDMILARRKTLPGELRRRLKSLDAQLAWDAPLETAFDDRQAEGVDWRVGLVLMVVIGLISFVIAGGDTSNSAIYALLPEFIIGALIVLIGVLMKMRR